MCPYTPSSSFSQLYPFQTQALSFMLAQEKGPGAGSALWVQLPSDPTSDLPDARAFYCPLLNSIYWGGSWKDLAKKREQWT